MRVADGGPEAATFCREEAEKATEATKQAAAKAVAAREKAIALVESSKNIAEGKVEEPPLKGDKGKAPPPAKGAKEAPKEVYHTHQKSCQCNRRLSSYCPVLFSCFESDCHIRMHGHLSTDPCGAENERIFLNDPVFIISEVSMSCLTC